MKRILSSLIAFVLLIPLVFVLFLNSSAEYPTTDGLNGYENLVLTYTHNPNRVDYGRHTVDDLKPYVGYYDKNGKLTDFFFDSYLFLPCMSYGPSGARMHHDANNPTKAIDWTNYVEDTFYKDVNVDALEVAFGEAKTALKAPDRKAGVVLTILYPSVEAGKSFGSLGGKELDLSKLEDRKYAIKWIIDEQLRLFNERGYKNLDLIGFYWLEEYIYGGQKGAVDKELFLYASNYLHSLGLKFVWIPWFRANGYSAWKQLGFDIACMQPNMYWQSEVDDKRVETCANDCKKFGMGMEIEIDNGAIKNADSYNRYLEYLRGGVKSGAMNTVKMYYQDGKSAVYYNAYKSTNERARSIYDLTYKYAKGTLTIEELEPMQSEIFKIPDDVDWISIGKNYTSSGSYSEEGKTGYHDYDGIELTDGKLGNYDIGTEWHAFHKTLLDSEGRMSVTVDLGEVRNDITHFMMHFSNIQMYGIGLPADDITIYISEDGTNFTRLAQPKLQFIDSISYIKYVTSPVSARYVKFSLINKDLNFVFCSEALVGVAKESFTPDPPESSEKTDEESENESYNEESENDSSYVESSKTESSDPEISETETSGDESNADEESEHSEVSVQESEIVSNTESTSDSTEETASTPSENNGTNNEEQSNFALYAIVVIVAGVIAVATMMLLIKKKHSK